MAELAHRIETRRDAPAYEQDWAAWVWRQVDLLKARRFEELDFENLADEVGSLARSDFKGWVSAIRLVLLHMLKWDLQPSHRSRSWQDSIVEHRATILDELNDSPSYRARIDEALAKAYPLARRQAATETDMPLKAFPEACPYDWTAITTREHPLSGDDA